MKREFKQQITDTSLLPEKVVVISFQGREYPVLLSHSLRKDYLDGKKEIREGDFGIIHHVHGQAYLHDVQKRWGTE